MAEGEVREKGPFWPTGSSFAFVPSVGQPRPGRRARSLVAVLALAGACVAFPVTCFLVLGALLWLQALLKVVACSHRPGHAEFSDPPVWPVFTVLVPLHNEQKAVPALVRALLAIDYPSECLDIRILCEADDPETLDAVADALVGTPNHIQRVSIPVSQPRTKPKALRVGLEGAPGEIVTVYDAEDAPHPQQLRAAARALHADTRLVAVQAPLSVDNLAPGWITRQFAVEYAALFHVWIPWLAEHGLVLPLGGTSNHIRRDALERAGGWDPFNVTEDADLSYRLALMDPRPGGGRIGWIPEGTSEEAVASFRAWRGQRSRWLKGYAQTVFVHLFTPASWGQPHRVRRQAAMLATVGLTLLTALLHVPALIGVGLAWAFGHPPSPPVATLGGMFYLSGIGVSWLGAKRAGVPVRALDLVTVPLYWALMAWPAWVGFLELFYRPHYWNKTAHGVSARRRDAACQTSPALHSSKASAASLSALSSPHGVSGVTSPSGVATATAV